jgi:hypothetical protein
MSKNVSDHIVEMLAESRVYAASIEAEFNGLVVALEVAPRHLHLVNGLYDAIKVKILASTK